MIVLPVIFLSFAPLFLVLYPKDGVIATVFFVAISVVLIFLNFVI